MGLNALLVRALGEFEMSIRLRIKIREVLHKSPFDLKKAYEVSQACHDFEASGGTIKGVTDALWEVLTEKIISAEKKG